MSPKNDRPDSVCYFSRRFGMRFQGLTPIFVAINQPVNLNLLNFSALAWLCEVTKIDRALGVVYASTVPSSDGMEPNERSHRSCN